ncbi:hypothetical protein CHS0354_042281 [Potamilus streckersoni]|uniref:CARD domain-containing protein n=1 Tax=Potamilus streckersoni TaxID=2493646 RepID=A0AAE0STQ5_9BIVA|nr:hypothetical protein CHS0354_042281 [Potamilus streckersoni]
MGDKSDDDIEHESNESIFMQIKHLEKQKADLERRNTERQMLEKKFRELRNNVSGQQLSPIFEKGRCQPSTSYAEDSISVGRLIQEGREQLQALQSQLAIRIEGAGNELELTDHESEEEEQKSSKDTAAMMSGQHKQKLQQEHRAALVENMIPDDIFNDLISKKVLTASDVTRIKEKNTREAINEELLDTLIRRPDRAFNVFVDSLKRTLQEHLASLIADPPLTPKTPLSARKGQKKQKRNKGELNLSLDVEDVVGISKGKSVCSCREVEEQLLLMAKHAYHNIRRRDETPAAFEQFRKELSQTNEIVRDSMEIMNTLKILCNHGRSINDISSGSILFNLQCSTQDGLKDIWDMYQTGSLQEQFQKSFVTENLKKQYHANDIKLKVTIPEEEFQQCQNDLVEMQLEKSKMVITERNLNLHSCNTTSGICNIPPTVPVINPKPERVFREIDKNCPYHNNSSPSKRKMLWPLSLDNSIPAKRTPPLTETDARPVQNFHQRLYTAVDII